MFDTSVAKAKPGVETTLNGQRQPGALIEDLGLRQIPQDQIEGRAILRRQSGLIFEFCGRSGGLVAGSVEARVIGLGAGLLGHG